MAKSPKERTMILLRQKGYFLDDTERRVGPPRKTTTVDFCGLFDIIAYDSDRTLGVQVCEKGSVLEHQRKFNRPDLMPKIICWIRGANRVALFVEWKQYVESDRWIPWGRLLEWRSPAIVAADAVNLLEIS
jgi:hypothetical protein